MAVGTIFFMANIIMGIVTDSLFFYRMSTASLIMRLERILAGLGIGLFIEANKAALGHIDLAAHLQNRQRFLQP